MSDLKDFTEKAAQAASDIAHRAASMTKQMSRIAKLNLDINSQKNTIKAAYTEIGKLYYEAHREDPEGFFTQLCQEIDLANEAIKTMEDEIAYLKKTAEEERRAREEARRYGAQDADFETVVDDSAPQEPDIEVEIEVDEGPAPAEPTQPDPAPDAPKEPEAPADDCCQDVPPADPPVEP